MTKHYTTEPDQKYIIWLATTQGDILILNPFQAREFLEVSTVTFTAHSESEMKNILIENLNISNVSDEDFKNIYEYQNEKNRGSVWLVEMSMEHELKQKLINKTNGTFINYVELDHHITQRIRPETKDQEFLEAFIALISYMGAKYENLKFGE